MSRMITFVAALLFALNAQALTVMSINAEWFWDGKEPHEGRVAFGAVGNPPVPRQVELEAFAIAQLINHNQADVVGLVEVEGRSVVERIIPYLNGDWGIAFKKGRDSITGQDVAVLTKLDIIFDTVTNYSDITGEFDGKEARPSKVLGVGLHQGGQDYLVITTHLISKRNDNDKKRAAQANAIAQAVELQAPSYDHIIVMGDLNDTLGSDTLNQITATGLASISAPGDYSYEFEGDKELIDHILVSDSLSLNSDFGTIDLGPISDHRAVIATFE